MDAYAPETNPFDGIATTELIRELIARIDPKPNRSGLEGTPDRVVRSHRELFSGYGQEPKDILTMFEDGGYDEIVLVRNIDVRAVCEHHMLPFVGYAHVAYIADGGIVGLSKLARLVDCFARRLTVQERITKQVVDAMVQYVSNKGAACLIRASHACMLCRGVNQDTSAITSCMSGAFRNKPEARAELLAMIGEI